jgi:hypothetical protein
MPLEPDVVNARGQVTFEEVAAGSKRLWSAAHALQAACPIRVFLVHLRSVDAAKKPRHALHLLPRTF